MGRLFARRIQRKLRIKRIIALPSIIIGTLIKAKKLYNDISKNTSWGFLPLGIVLNDKSESNEVIVKGNSQDIPILGTIENLGTIIDINKPKEVLITGEHLDFRTLFNIASLCSEKNIGVKIQPDLYSIVTGQTKTLHIYGIPLIDINPLLLKPWEQFIKRTFDIIFSFIIIVAGIPLWLLIALAIKLESKGPVFYCQKRIGKNGKEFTIYKFRSMVNDSDKKFLWTVLNDPRVTKVGKILRKTHLDEVPQFWNTLKGDMSIVGPRPEQPQLVEQFSVEIPYYKRRLKIRPGITGWSQVKFEPYFLNKEEVENRLKDDFYYIENMSLKLDIEIIIRTIWCVVTGHGQA
jgi:exopolysaccharide biosynthesis polyprenyl glycosylphosphotransferase